MNPIAEVENPAELRHGLGPIWTAARIANPDFAICSPVTFRAAAGFGALAAAWRETIFEPSLLPALRAAAIHAGRGEVRELAALDRALSGKLPGTVQADSLRAGHRLAVHGRELRGDRLLPRLAETIRTGAMPGHFAIVFAARGAAFSLSTRAAIGAYLFQEMCAGAPAASVVDVCNFVAACLEPLGASTFELRAA